MSHWKLHQRSPSTNKETEAQKGEKRKVILARSELTGGGERGVDAIYRTDFLGAKVIRRQAAASLTSSCYWKSCRRSGITLPNTTELLLAFSRLEGALRHLPTILSLPILTPSLAPLHLTSRWSQDTQRPV